MANYKGVVALLLGIFLPSILGQSTKVCGYSHVHVVSQCKLTSHGGGLNYAQGKSKSHGKVTQMGDGGDG